MWWCELGQTWIQRAQQPHNFNQIIIRARMFTARFHLTALVVHAVVGELIFFFIRKPEIVLHSFWSEILLISHHSKCKYWSHASCSVCFFAQCASYNLLIVLCAQSIAFHFVFSLLFFNCTQPSRTDRENMRETMKCWFPQYFINFCSLNFSNFCKFCKLSVSLSSSTATAVNYNRMENIAKHRLEINQFLELSTHRLT